MTSLLDRSPLSPTVRTRPARSRLMIPVALSLAITAAITPAAPSAATGTSRTSATGTSSTSFVNSGLVTLVRLGDRGNSVTLVQQALMSQGIALRGGADGYFGPVTLAAVKTFQGQKGLEATGDVNSVTAHLLGLGGSPALPERGQQGDLVKTLQQALINASISVRGGVDGIFGPGTAAAVQAFQSSRGLPSTGVVDLTTGIALGIVPGALPASAAPTTAAPASGQTSSISFTANAYLTSGQVGDAVKAMQSALITAGVAVRGGADGIYGPATSQAVATFQTNLRLPATGTVDTLTAQLLGLVAGPALPKLGEKSPNVASLQQLLINLGIPVKGGADGSFGPVTQGAVTTFQRSQSLPANGVVDLRTALFLGLIPGATPPAKFDPSAPLPGITGTSVSGNPMLVFPVLGPCFFADTWDAPRSGGRRHEGVDIIAKTGTPVYAVVAGTITRQFFDQAGSLGGNALRLTAPDGTYFYYAHFSAFAEGIKVGSVLRAGEVIGYVGATGNTTTPHLHFEYHPGGGAAVNPYPFTKAIDRCKVTTPPEIIG